METFLTQIALYFDAEPKKVIYNAIRYYYGLDNMLYILYCYFLNIKDPFLDKEIYMESLKKQGIRYIINTLFTLLKLLDSEENQTIATIVMSDYNIRSESYSGGEIFSNNSPL